MVKENVVVFDGEDKFITPKNRLYNKKIGKSNFIGEMNGQTGERPPATTLEGNAFKQYMLKKDVQLVVPVLSDADFCVKAKSFIETNGDGRATPDQIMQVYQLFQDNCIEKVKDEKPIEDNPQSGTTNTNKVVFPSWQTFDCETLAEEIAKFEQKKGDLKLEGEDLEKYDAAIREGKSLQQSRCPEITPNKITIGSIPSLGIDFSVPTLGKPPQRAGDKVVEDGVSNDNQAIQPVKGNPNWIVWLLLGGAVIYLVTRKK